MKKFLGFLYKSRLPILGIFIVWLSIVLCTWDSMDPGCSHSWKASAIKNQGGLLGAYVADCLFFLFGFSAWWFVVFLMHFLWSGFFTKYSKSMLSAQIKKYIGFCLIMVGSISLEVLIFQISLKQSFNLNIRFLGIFLINYLFKEIGPLLTVTVLIAIFLFGLRLFFSFSWISIPNYLVGFFDKYLKLKRKNGDRFLKKEKLDWFRKKENINSRLNARNVKSKLNIDNQKEFFRTIGKKIKLPDINLLDISKSDSIDLSKNHTEITSAIIEKKLGDFGISASVIAEKIGPVITCYEIEPAVGVKGNQIIALKKDLARALGLDNLRITETMPGKNCMGIEIPNPVKRFIHLAEVIKTPDYLDNKSPATLALGQDIFGNPVVADLLKMPHLLLAGTTGSGKSVSINTIILSLLYKAKPSDIRIILIDPKMLEMSLYEGIPHLLAPIITDMQKATNALAWCVQEMQNRYTLMSKLGVRNLDEYNNRMHMLSKNNSLDSIKDSKYNLPIIILIVDELSDLIMSTGKKAEELIVRLAQKARASGIHLILATQRPSVDVVTGLIKANIPARIAFQVSSRIDSRTILDQGGAENLLGQGDMLYLSSGSRMTKRVHGAFVSKNEIDRIIQFLKNQEKPGYIEDLLT